MNVIKGACEKHLRFFISCVSCVRGATFIGHNGVTGLRICPWTNSRLMCCNGRTCGWSLHLIGKWSLKQSAKYTNQSAEQITSTYKTSMKWTPTNAEARNIYKRMSQLFHTSELLSPFGFLSDFSLITRDVPKEVAEVDFWKKALFPTAVPFLHLKVHIMTLFSRGFDNLRGTLSKEPSTPMLLSAHAAPWKQNSQQVVQLKTPSFINGLRI